MDMNNFNKAFSWNYVPLSSPNFHQNSPFGRTSSFKCCYSYMQFAFLGIVNWLNLAPRLDWTQVKLINGEIAFFTVYTCSHPLFQIVWSQNWKLALWKLTCIFSFWRWLKGQLRILFCDTLLWVTLACYTVYFLKGQ